ncbi:type II inositol 3,4-bisphosphate 4-phosphatase-like [Dysidea avara]|uniref:type II inositol 3,4-bisphosphate 4-phosphatase-like n=1 Tax=Dysidea avara TaxID=196820 RepID=UPI003318F655
MRFNEKEMANLACTCEADIEGLLDKRGKGSTKGYNPRWFRLKGNLLFYFKATELGNWDKSSGESPIGVIILERCQVQKSPSDIRPFCFSLRFEDEESRSYDLAASSENEMHRWISAIRTASYEGLRSMLYQLQNEMIMLTGQDPLNIQGLSHESVKKPKKMVDFVTRRQPRGTQKRLNRLSQIGGQPTTSLDQKQYPKYELSLSCSCLPLVEGGQPPNTFVRTNLIRVPRGIQGPLGLSCTEVIESSCDPLYFTLVLLEVTPRIPQQCQLQFEVYSVPKELLFIASQSSLEGCTEEESDQYAQAKLMGHAECTIKDVISSKDHDGLKLLISIGNTDTVIPCCLNVIVTKVGDVPNPAHQLHQAQTISQEFTLPSPLKNSYEKHFRFPCRDGGTLKVIEEMGESVFNIQIPLELVKCYSREDMAWLKELQGLGKLMEPWNNHLITAQAILMEAVSFYQASTQDLQSFIVEGAHGFKRSTCRKDHTLSLIPTNLHIQTLRVQPAPNVRERVCHTVTIGCPADHPAGFKNGGLKKLLQEARSNPSFINCSEGSKASTIKQTLASLQQIMENTAGYRDLLLKYTGNADPQGMNEALQGISSEVQQLLWQMQTGVVMEAIKELRSARLPPGNYVSSLRRGSSIDDAPFLQGSGPSDWVWDGREFLQFSTQFSLTKTSQRVQKSLINLLEVVERATLLTVEQQHEAVAAGGVTSYRPTYCWSYELIPVVAQLYQTLDGLFSIAKTSLTFSLLQLDCLVQGVKVLKRRRDVVFSQALTGLVTSFYLTLSQRVSDNAFLEQISKCGFLAQFSSLLSCNGDEQGMLEDMMVIVQELRSVSFQICENFVSDRSSLYIQISGTRDNLVVQLLLPNVLLRLVNHDAIRSGELVRVVPVMFTQGVHDIQVLSNLQFQDDINAKGFKILSKYIDNYERLELSQSNKLQGLKTELQKIEEMYIAQKTKNVEFISSVEALCRVLNAGRLTSCKSAKDRSSMAVTLEETLHLVNNHGVLQSHFDNILMTLRSKGTRLYNCYKNTSHYRYAFSPISYHLLPKLYQPPSHTCSSTVRDNDCD